MTINYNVTGTERKRLADYIAGFLGCDAKYQYAPSFAYQVGFITVGKTGTIRFDDRAISQDTKILLTELEAQGFHAAEPVEPTAEAVELVEETAQAEVAEPEEPGKATTAAERELPAKAEPAAQGETVGLTVAIPLVKVNVGNLTNLLDAKGTLIQRALGITATPIEVSEDKVSFPWFTELPEPDAAQAYAHFISALCEMSANQKRVTAKEKPVDNEKYAFRCFLLRLGFIGTDYKAERKILLRNLTGSSAFKSGARREVSSDAVPE